MSKKKIYHGTKGERIECNCSNYEDTLLRDKLWSGFIWCAWMAGILFLCVKCCGDMI